MKIEIAWTLANHRFSMQKTGKKTPIESDTVACTNLHVWERSTFCAGVCGKKGSRVEETYVLYSIHCRGIKVFGSFGAMLGRRVASSRRRGVCLMCRDLLHLLLLVEPFYFLFVIEELLLGAAFEEIVQLVL